MLGILVIAIVVLLFLGPFFLLFAYPQSTLVTYFTRWEFRQLRKIREEYLWGLQKKEPDTYEHFRRRAIYIISNEHSYHSSLTSGEARREKAEEIIEMLNYEQFIHYYLSNFHVFSGQVFHEMYKDFRTGEYKKDYSDIVKLRKILPIQIASSDSAFKDYMKFVDKGWFNISTGMYVLSNGRNHQYIGRAIYWICHRNGISSPERVFASLWGTPEKKIKEWCRANKNETITTRIDDIVSQILNG